MLKLETRDAVLGRNLPFRTEDHGDTPVKATDIPIAKIMLTAAELADVLEEPEAHAALFETRSASKLVEPLFKGLAPLRLTDRLDATVTLHLGAFGKGGTLKLGPCKLKDVTLEPRIGGLTEMSCKIQATPAIDKHLAELVEYLGQSCQIDLEAKHPPEQRDLVEDAGRAGEDADDGEESDDGSDSAEAKRARARGKKRNGARVNA